MRATLLTIIEFLVFLKENKPWWIIPIFFFLILFSWLMVGMQSSAIAPFIYTIF